MKEECPMLVNLPQVGCHVLRKCIPLNSAEDLAVPSVDGEIRKFPKGVLDFAL